MTARLSDDCFVLDKDRLPHREALAILKARVGPVVAVEEISLAEAAGRFLAESVVAPRPIPAHDNAAVDGYAFAFAAYDRDKGARLEIAGEARAGHPFPSVPPKNLRGTHLYRRGDAIRARHRGDAGGCAGRAER